MASELREYNLIICIQIFNNIQIICNKSDIRVGAYVNMIWANTLHGYFLCLFYFYIMF